MTASTSIDLRLCHTPAVPYTDSWTQLAPVTAVPVLAAWYILAFIYVFHKPVGEYFKFYSYIDTFCIDSVYDGRQIFAQIKGP